MKKRKLWIGTILSIILISPFHKKNHFYKNIKMVKNPANLDILVNKNNKLDKNYIPTDLELIDINYAYENKYLRKEAKEMFEKLSKAHKYGFILRYPKGKEKITGFKYEPWHYRYIGIDIATEIYEKDITLEEYKNDR